MSMTASRLPAPPDRSLQSWFEDVRCILVAAGTRAAGESFATRHRLNVAAILTRGDLLVRPGELRRRVREANADMAVIHSSDWSRQQNPQLYEFALALMPVRERLIVDEARRVVRRLGGGAAARRVAAALSGVILPGATIAAEAVHMSSARWLPSTLPTRRSARRTDAVLAIWPGSGHSFGGSITHITGILGGFRHAGLRTAILTTAPPPEEVQAVVDDLEVIATPPPGARLTGDSSQIYSNRLLRAAGARLAQRLAPAFVYQRHSPFLLAGAAVSRKHGIPLVLEWNASEVYVRHNWHESLPVERILDRVLEGAERAVVADASLIAAVSTEAENMAVRAGASREKTLLLPNAVDIAYVDRCLRVTAVPRTANHPLLGWAGTFGDWHGAEMIVRALSRLPPHVRLLMIGDGDERATCQRLANELGVAARIEWAGAIPRPQALRRLAACDLLVSPHVPLRGGQPFFGSPTKLFEYMALGRPIVASRLAQIGEVLEDQVTARLVTPGDVTELAEAIGEVLDSDDQGSHLGVAARREAESRHTWDHRANAVLERLGRRAP